MSTSEQHKSGARVPRAYDANKQVALAAIDNGIGFSHVNSILTSLNIPKMTRKAYKIREREVGEVAELVAKGSCVYFADSLALTKQLLKEKNQALRNTDGTIPKANLRDIYSCLFQTEFCNSHQGLADVQALREVLFQSNLKLTSKDTVNKSNVMNFATLEGDVKYLDDSHDRLLTFRNQLYDETEQSVVTKSLAKKLADSGLTMSDLRKLYTSAGPRGIAALLSHPPSSSEGKSPRGTKCATEDS